MESERSSYLVGVGAKAETQLLPEVYLWRLREKEEILWLLPSSQPPSPAKCLLLAEPTGKHRSLGNAAYRGLPQPQTAEWGTQARDQPSSHTSAFVVCGCHTH